MTLRIESLHLYPVKALAAVDISSGIVEPRGFAHDRRWMLVDGAGKFITQREYPKLARLAAAVTDTGLRITQGPDTLDIPRPAPGSARLDAILWKQPVEGYTAGDAADTWFSDFLQAPCRLVYQGDLKRPIVNQWAPPETEASYADGYPFLVATTASLDDLNRRMAKALPMNRFRPNIVIAGATPWAEDGWKKIRVGNVTLDLVKPCTRCVVTKTDQHSGERDGNEPLDALKKFRLLRIPGLTGVAFAQNAVPEGAGTISVGDAVEVLETQAPPAFSGVG